MRVNLRRRKGKKNSSLERYFTEVFNMNLFRGEDSRSGAGSDSIQTGTIRREIPMLLKELKAKSLADIPSGDFNWAKLMNLENISYIGYDIVEPLISNLSVEYKSINYKFKTLNVVSEIFQKVDLILCRDLLCHLSYDDSKKALKNMKKSGSKYLLTTTFPEHHNNFDLTYSPEGVGWYPINLGDEPFNLGEPIKLINENCSEGEMLFSDKSLGLYLLN